MFETAMFYELMAKIVKKCHDNFVSHGFWTGAENDNLPTKIALMHSELSELLEAFRKGNQPCTKVMTSQLDGNSYPLSIMKEGKHRTITNVEEEAADLFIRLCDFCGRYGVDLGRVTLAKMSYNESRPYMHGGMKI